MRKAYAAVVVSGEYMDDDPAGARNYVHERLREQLEMMGCDLATIQIVMDGERVERMEEVEPRSLRRRIFDWLRGIQSEEPEVFVEYRFKATAREEAQ